MTTQTLNIRWPVAALIAAVLVTGTAAITYFETRELSRQAPTPQPVAEDRTAVTAPVAPAAVTADALPDVVVPMSRELIERAGIKLTKAARASGHSEMRVPAVISANAYKSVAVTPTAGGRVTAIAVQLGDHVRRGQVLAQIYSADLADAQARYASARAELDAHDRAVVRTEKLTEIGAASRQELERIHAEHAERRAAVESAASQLRLLGSTTQVPEGGRATEPVLAVPSPLDGVVTERMANVGLNVDKGTTLFAIVDLTTVWVVADIFEKDFSRVRVGTKATVTLAAYPGSEMTGQVSYIDPQVNQATRTAKVRVELPNRDGRLRFGMLAEVRFDVEGTDAVEIPRTAFQNVGDSTVVYLASADHPNAFIERQVRTQAGTSDRVIVLSGVGLGESLVSEGSFFVRAERERLGLRPPASVAVVPAPRPSEAVQTAKIVVDDKGFHPSTLRLRAGIPARLTFVRTSDGTCATEVSVPSLNIKRALPLNHAVDIEFTPAAGEVAFACGLNMFKGTITVQ